jgi:hypothetical protein
MRTFAEYCQDRQYREGLWLNDKNAIVGLSKIAPPTPIKQPKPPAPPKIKPVRMPAPPKPMGEVQVQLPDAWTMMARMGISPVEPSKDQMTRFVDKAKKQVIVPQPSQSPVIKALPKQSVRSATSSPTYRSGNLRDR